jgi:hypothetical protein
MMFVQHFNAIAVLVQCLDSFTTHVMLDAIIYKRSSLLPNRLLRKCLGCQSVANECRKRITKVYSQKDQMLLLHRPVYNQETMCFRIGIQVDPRKSTSKPPM